MFIIEDDVLYLTRGDTAYLNVALQDADGEALDGTAAITFSCKKNVKDENYAFQCFCNYPEQIKIEPEQTKELEYGKYLYDIQVTMDNGDIFTIVSGPIYIKEEITNE